jgi:DNA-binding FrmR family transcriptional regulator
MDANIKKRAMHRAKILEGQLRGLHKMIENEDYCMDIITQSLAVQKSLGSLNKLMAENHIMTHISQMMSSGNPALISKAKEELSKIYELTNNRGTK